MTYYDARQHTATRKWHYTSLSRDGIHAVGFCSADGGHDTEEEARACYRAHLLATAKFGKAEDLRACCYPSCGEPTETTALVGERLYFLCEEHGDEESLEVVVPAVGSIVVS